MEKIPTHHRYLCGEPHWWQWLTILSLDAPLVAVAWQRGLAWAAHGPLRWHHQFILGAAVWLAYAADRWIEGWRLNPTRVRTQRHWFYQRWRWPVAIVWSGVLLATLGPAFTELTRTELKTGLLLLAPVLLYLISHQLIHRHHRWRAPKELCVALLFTAGAACFPTANQAGFLKEIETPLILFCLLCFADCALISLWEDDVDLSHGQTSLALQFPRSRPYVRSLPWIIAFLGIMAATRANTVEMSAISTCAGASGIFLGAVDLAQRRLGRQLSRTLADVALMTPAILLFWLLRPRS